MLDFSPVFLPLLVFLGFAVFIGFRRSRDQKRWTPATRDRLLRPAGESLRIEIERLDEKFNDAFMWIAFAVFIPPVMGFFAGGMVEGPGRFWIIFALPLAASVFVLKDCFKVLAILKRRKRYQLGFEGERLVGEYLSALLADGYRVFHDVPFDAFNVDHVVVGPAGVFAVETKTRRKRKELKDNHKLRFDGKLLHWPDGQADDYGVGNAYDRAMSLQKWLSSAVGVTIEVKGLLVFPGWMVQEEALGKVRVLNPKNVRGHVKAIERKMTPLSDQLIRQISHQLAEKVRLPE